MGKLLYPPLKVVRQNTNHIFRVIIDSRNMIKFLENNYATPINSNTEYCYFDINLKDDKKSLVASTDPSFLEVVYGEDNPYFKRKAHVISPYGYRVYEDDDTETVGKREVLNRTLNANRIFVGQVAQVFEASSFVKKNGEKAATRKFILENTVDGYTQEGLFEIYREGKFCSFILEDFKVEVGDWLKVEYFMKVNSFEGTDGIWRHANTNKVYKFNFVTKPLTKGFKGENDNPFHEVIRAEVDDSFMKKDQLKRKRDNE